MPRFEEYDLDGKTIMLLVDLLQEVSFLTAHYAHHVKQCGTTLDINLDVPRESAAKAEAHILDLNEAGECPPPTISRASRMSLAVMDVYMLLRDWLVIDETMEPKFDWLQADDLRERIEKLIGVSGHGRNV